VAPLPIFEGRGTKDAGLGSGTWPQEKVDWGAPKIQDELQTLGLILAETSVARCRGPSSAGV